MTSDAVANCRTYLESHQVLTLATFGPDGPWAAAVFYVSAGWDLFFLSAAHTRHARNFIIHSHVAGAIQEDYRDWPEIKGIQLEGRVTLLSGAERSAAIARYEHRYPFLAHATDELRDALQRVNWYRLKPARLYFIDNSRGLGHRDEIPL